MLTAGDGDPRLPSWDGETFAHYLWRLAKFLGKTVGPEPTVSDPLPKGTDPERTT